MEIWGQLTALEWAAAHRHGGLDGQCADVIVGALHLERARAELAAFVVPPGVSLALACADERVVLAAGRASHHLPLRAVDLSFSDAASADGQAGRQARDGQGGREGGWCCCLRAFRPSTIVGVFMFWRCPWPSWPVCAGRAGRASRAGSAPTWAHFC